MTSKVFTYLVLALLFMSAGAIGGKPEDGSSKESGKGSSEKSKKAYKELTDESKFGKFITDHDNALVLFYAPWCKHCKELMPAFKAASKTLSAKKNIFSARINGDKFKAVSDSYNVDGFPTIIVFKKAVPHVYEGDQSANDIVSFAEKVAGPPLKALNTQEDFDAFVAAHPVTVIACLARPQQDENENDNEQSDDTTNFVRKIFFNTASKLYAYSDIYFGVVDNPSVATGRSAATSPAVVYRAPEFPLREYVFEQMEAEESEQQQEVEKAAARNFVSWLNTASIPILDDISNANYMRYIKSDNPIIWLVLRDRKNETLIEWFRSVAKEYAGKLHFVILDDNLYHDQSKVLGVSEANVYPSVAISYGRKNYAMDKTDAEALSADTTKAFIEKFLSGELSKRVRSQPLPDPAENAKKLVKDVVALNFQAVALDPRKDVLVKFYASWCGHCKETAPAYERAASLLSSVNSVVFAQIEASENDVPEALRIAGYPTFILFPATPESTPVYFNAPEVTAEDIAMFVHDNAAVKFDVPAELAEAVAAKEKEREKTESEAKADAVKEGEEEEEEENVIVVEEERKEEL